MPATETDERFIREAFALAGAARSQRNHPFAALLVRHDQVVARFPHHKLDVYDPIKHAKSNPTAHPELNLIREFCKSENVSDLIGYTLYTNVEPCPMCAGAIYYASISRLVFSIDRPTFYRLRNEFRKPTVRSYQSCEAIIRDGTNCCEIVGGVLAEEGVKIFAGYEFPSTQKIRSQIVSESRVKKTRRK